MTSERIRAYERRLCELARGAGFSDAQQQVMRDHLREVAQLRMLSAPAALERDSANVRRWLASEWQRLAESMPETWPAMERELGADLENGPMAVA